MKTLFLAAMAFISLAALGFSQASPANNKKQPSGLSSNEKPETPFYCNRSAISPEQRKRKTELDHILLSLNAKIRELKDGFEFEFPPDSATFRAAAEWAAMEHACCPFFDISLQLQREGGPFRLRLTGREGVKQFILAELPQARRS